MCDVVAHRGEKKGNYKPSHQKKYSRSLTRGVRLPEV